MAVPEVPASKSESARDVPPFPVPASGEDKELSDGEMKILFSRCKRFLLSRGAKEEDAEDCAQESVWVTWQRTPPLCGDDVTAFALRVALNKWIDLQRKRGRQPSTPLEDWDGASDQDVELLAETSDDVRQAISILKAEVPSKKQRDVFVMCELWGLTSGEAGELLGVTPEAVRRRLLEARARLRNRLNGE